MPQCDSTLGRHDRANNRLRIERSVWTGRTVNGPEIDDDVAPLASVALRVAGVHSMHVLTGPSGT
jgi:hypothetical protein